MSEPITLYTTPLAPDPNDARAVLAFLLVSPRAFCTDADDAETVESVRDMLDRAKRDFLLQWYAQHLRSST
jgi:hypothetical protein